MKLLGNAEELFVSTALKEGVSIRLRGNLYSLCNLTFF
jgi:hypothetical protein